MNYLLYGLNSSKINKFIQKANYKKVNDINGNLMLIEENAFSNYLALKEYLSKKDIFIDFVNQKKYNDEVYNLEYTMGLSFHIVFKFNGVFYGDILNADMDLLKIIYDAIFKFGFILRYPDINSLYIRYVGLIPARIIRDYNLSLEEYVNDFSCVLFINKPKNITSFDVVSDIRRLFGIKRVGHTGTLDPLATGVMIVTIGRACKIVDLLVAYNKEYIASVKLGIKTDTYDITGNVISSKDKAISVEKLKKALNSFKKTYYQEVPIYSAIKVDGKKLYDYARSNLDVSLPKKLVTINNIELLDMNGDSFRFKADVSKGCYIRSLIVDIASSLDTYATMTDLVRVRQGNISINDTQTLDDIKNNDFIIHSIDEVLNYDVIVVSSSLLFKIKNGNVIPNIWNVKDKVIFKDNTNKIIGIYEVFNDNELKCFKNFI